MVYLGHHFDLGAEMGQTLDVCHFLDVKGRNGVSAQIWGFVESRVVNVGIHEESITEVGNGHFPRVRRVPGSAGVAVACVTYVGGSVRIMPKDRCEDEDVVQARGKGGDDWILQKMGDCNVYWWVVDLAEVQNKVGLFNAGVQWVGVGKVVVEEGRVMPPEMGVSSWSSDGDIDHEGVREVSKVVQG